ncbi:hypothetical protein GDO78_016249 [Eleutherodactylus coqui]|uniref:Uncharacterized protein n=1 Tax=Eleutherodactylus coqui TaxID=57060 RepID=A0A8J6B567_ELECQ|nr:hypothetical protein GDO78_016249 [Eleutherodactylus coqui]
MDGSGPENGDPLPIEVMVQSREDEGQPPPAELPLGATMQESGAPLIHPAGKNGLGVIQSPVNTASLPSDSPQKGPQPSLPAAQDALQATTGPPSPVDGSTVYLVAEDSSGVPQTPTSKSSHVMPPIQGLPSTCDAVEPPTLQNSCPAVSQTPAKGPKKRGRKSKAELLRIKAAQELMAPLVHPPGRKGLGVIQSPVNTTALTTDSPQKRAPASQDTPLTTADAPPVDGGDKCLASEDPLILQTSAKVPKKRGRKSKAELLMMKMAQESEAQALVESRQSDSENVELELNQSGRPRRRAAKTALKHFQAIADEWAASGRSSPPKTEEKVPEETAKKRRRKRKSDDSDDDFVVSEEVLQQEQEEVEDDSLSGEESDDDLSFFRRGVFAPGEKVYANVKGTAENGLHNSIMAPVWAAAAVTMDFREAHYSDWEYPEWVPHKDSWHFLSHSEAEIYLPLQTTSPPFCIRREGLEEDSNPLVLDR